MLRYRYARLDTGTACFRLCPDGTLYFVRSERGGRRAYALGPDGGAVEPVESLAQYDHVDSYPALVAITCLYCFLSRSARTHR